MSTEYGGFNYKWTPNTPKLYKKKRIKNTSKKDIN